MYVGKLFAGYIFYVDDILFIIAISCYGLQQMVNMCGVYGHMWDIAFNISKCQGITYLESTLNPLMLFT